MRDAFFVLIVMAGFCTSVHSDDSTNVFPAVPQPVIVTDTALGLSNVQ